MHKSEGSLRNSFDVINNMIDSLYEHCKRDFNLYLFDNESDEVYNVPDYPNLRYTYIKDQSLRKLAGPHNDGYDMAIEDGCDIIIATNDDIIINPTINDYIDIITNHFCKDNALYLPLTDGLTQNKSFQLADEAGEGIKEITYELKPWCYLNGFMFAFTREAYYKWRLPNGKLLPEDWERGGEKILTRQIREKGARIFIIKNCWIKHLKLREYYRFLKLTPRIHRRLLRERNESKNKTKNTVRRKRATKR